MADLFRYAAFISYSSKDAVFARKLHRALESYGIPASLGKFDLIGGGKANRIYPVFRDREELSAGQLGDQIEANLRASAALIVVCSPDGAASPWVQKEIEFFAAQGRHAKIFAIIPDTAPLVDENGADCTQSCFPPAFRGDALAGDKLEPLAADARKDKDGFRNAWLKIVAGMIGVTPGQIIDRDRQRRAQRALVIGVAAAVLALGVGYSAAWTQAGRERELFASYADQLLREERLADASAYAIASAPGRGDLVLAQPVSSGGIMERAGLRAQFYDLGVDDRRDLTLSDHLGHEIPWALTSYAPEDETTFASGGYLWTFGEHTTRRDLGSVSSALASKNGRILLTIRPEGERERLLYWDVASDAPPVDLGVFNSVGGFDLSADGGVVAATERVENFDYVTYAWDMRGGHRRREVGAGNKVTLAPDGDFLLVSDPVSGSMDLWTYRVYDLRNPHASPRDLGEAHRASFAPDGRSVLVTTTEPNSNVVRHSELWDLLNPTPARAVGSFAMGEWSADGNYFLGQVHAGSVIKSYLWETHANSAPVLLATGHTVAGYRFTPDSAWLLMIDGGNTYLWNVRERTRVRDLGAAIWNDDEGREYPRFRAQTLVVRTQEDATAWSLLTGASRQLDRIGAFVLTDDGATLLAENSSSGVEQVWNLASEAPATTIESNVSPALSTDGAFLVRVLNRRVLVLDRRSGAERDLAAGDDVALMADGRTLLVNMREDGQVTQTSAWNLASSTTGRSLGGFITEAVRPPGSPVLVGYRQGISSTDRRAMMWDMRNDAPPLDFGLQQGVLGASSRLMLWSDGRSLIGRRLLDLRTPLRTGPAAGLRPVACQANADSILPFDAGTRRLDFVLANAEHGQEPPSATTRALYSHLRGRPWNPCDWRGLLAGPEGWAQWWRMIAIRHFNAPDYGCAERSAAGRISEERRAMCRAIRADSE